MACLPEDLVFGILERLSVKLLMRFKCVSKSWCNLIKRSDFIEGHHRRQRKMLMLLRCNRPVYSFSSLSEMERIRAVQSLSFHDMDSSELKEVCQDFRFPEHPHHARSTLLGPSEGLVCVIHDGNLFVCNPAMRQFKLLPLFDDCPPVMDIGCGRGMVARGWGFCNTRTDGFKVVHVMRTSDLKVYEVCMYNSTTNTWRQIRGDEGKVMLQYSSYIHERGFTLNSTCHWLVNSFEDQYPRVIVTCDLSAKIMGYFGCPDSLNSPPFAAEVQLMVLNECLSLIRGPTDYKTRSYQISYDIWVMEEYGVKDSWTKRFVTMPDFVEPPLLFWRNNELLMGNKEIGICTLTSCDLGTNQLELLKIAWDEERFHVDAAVIYQESLLSVL